MELTLQAQLESILFWKGEPVSLKELSHTIDASADDVCVALEALGQDLLQAGRGISLLITDETYELVTHAAMSEKIEALTKEELTKDLSKAALETLSIILYRAPVKRSEIDYIRGVNSQTILRILSIRGLIDKRIDPKDERAYVYTPSADVLKLLGATSQQTIPDFSVVNQDIDAFLETETSDTQTQSEQSENTEQSHGGTN